MAGARLRTVGEVVAAARTVLDRGTRAVLVSLGARGALLVTGDGVWWAGGPSLVPVSTVGAGDATLAGWLAAEGEAPPERLRSAVVWGRAAVLLPGTLMPGPGDLEPSSVTVVADPDPAVPVVALAALASPGASRPTC